MIKKLFHHPLYCLLLFFLLGFLIYSPSLNGEFQFDDHEYIVRNSDVHQLEDIGRIYNHFPVPTRFIGLLSFAVNYQLHGTSVLGYHLTNVVIHIINTFLVYKLVTLLSACVRCPARREEGGSPGLALIVAMLFLVHPVQTQAVSYITQRFTSLATLFYLAAMWSWLTAWLKPAGALRKGWLATSIICGGLAMMTKQIALTLPIMMLISYYAFFGNKSNTTNSRAAIVMWCGCVLGIGMIPAMYGFRISEIIGNQIASHSHVGDTITSLNYLWTQPTVIWTYIRLLIIPWGQNLDYDYPVVSELWHWPTWLAIVGILTLLSLAAVYRSRRPVMAFGIFWFFVTLLVESSVIPIRHVIFEHRMYLPSIGFFMVMSDGIWMLLGDRRGRMAVTAGLIGVLSILTIQRNQVWRSEIKLWQDVVQKSPDKHRGYLNLGRAYLKQGQDRQGLNALQQALKLDPANVDVLNARGLYLYERQLYAMALDDFNQALEHDPDSKSARVNRGNVFSRIGKYREALTDYQAALRLDPNDFRTYVNRGNVFAKMKRYEEALADFKRAQQLQPDYPVIQKSIARTYELKGDLDRALTHYADALAAGRPDVSVQLAIARLQARQNNFSAAIDAFDQAVEMEPDRADIYYQRSFMFFTQRDYDRAYDDIISAQRLNHPVNPAYVERIKRHMAEADKRP